MKGLDSIDFCTRDIEIYYDSDFELKSNLHKLIDKSR